MPVYKIQAPDGNTYSISGPDGATQEQIQAQVLAQHPDAANAAGPHDGMLQAALGKLRNVYGSYMEPAAVMASGAVAKPISDVAGLAAIPANALGLTDKSPADVKSGIENAMTYQPRTEAGQQATSLLGKAADATIGSAGRLASSYYGGAADTLGLPQGVGQALRNGATELTNQVPGLMGARAPEIGAARVAQAGAAAPEAVAAAKNFAAAKSAGYAIPPTEATNAPIGKNLLTGVAGKDQVNAAFAHANQAVTDRIAKTDIGVPKDVPLDEGITKATDEANQAYAAIKNADKTPIPQTSPNGVVLRGPDGNPLTKPAGPIQPDGAYKADIAKVGDFVENKSTGQTLTGQAAELKNRYSDISSLTTDDTVRAMQRLRAEARTNFKAVDNVDKQDLAHVQMDISDALEAQLGRYLQGTGQSDLYGNFTAARTRLAKVNDIVKSMDGDNVNAAKIKAIQDKRGGLTGGLAQIADAATNFGRVVRSTKGLDKPGGLSAFSYGMALAGLPTDIAAGTHGVGTATSAALAGALAAKPLARSFLGSKFYQGQLKNQVPAAGPLSTLAARPESPLAGLALNPDELSRQE